jgi:hypothetical protein
MDIANRYEDEINGLAQGCESRIEWPEYEEDELIKTPLPDWFNENPDFSKI